MIQIGEISFALDDPSVVATILTGAFGALILLLLLLVLRRAGRSAAAVVPLAQGLDSLAARVQSLSDGQQQLAGSIQVVSETQAAVQSRIIQTVEARLAEVQQQMSDRLTDNALKSARAMNDIQERMRESLYGTSEKTTESLAQLQERLATIDKAQSNIEKLSGDVLSLQDILSNKQTRGAFGEIQLKDIVGKALPADSFVWQATLSNGRRADCLVRLPNPPGPIAIDAKFPLEAYERLVNAKTDEQRTKATTAFRQALRVHISAIAERYIVEGETADGAIMFLPSEAIYAELHARLPEVVREGFELRVWIVSPTTCMATLNTMRAVLKDVRMQEHAGAIRKALTQLHRDVEIVGEKTAKLQAHFRQARDDLDGLATASERAGKRALRLDNFDFEELSQDTHERVVRLEENSVLR